MDRNLRKLAYAAIAAAAVFVITHVFMIPIPNTAGYVNLGDTAIYITASLLGGPLAAAAAAVGSAVADLSLGAAIYAPATFVIKGLMGYVAGLISEDGKFLRYVLACAAGGAIMTLGYALYETCVFGLAYAAGTLLPNVGQWAASVAVSAALFPAVKRIKGVISSFSI